jgi:hypothetical protein
VTTAVKKPVKKGDARKRDVHEATSRWPVTVAAVLAVLAVLLALFLVLRRHQNDVVSFQGSPTEVVVQSSAGLVIVVPSDGNQVQVSRRAKWTLFKPDMSVGVEGGSLVVKADCYGPSFICDVQYRVSVPSDVSVRVVGGGGDVQIDGIGGKVDVQTSSGDVTLTNLTSDVKVRTSSGDVSLASMAGKLDLATDSGSITGSSITSGTIQTGTSSGDTSLNVTGSADRIGAGSSSGDISLVVPDLAYQVDAKSASGDAQVDVTQSADATRTITATTGSGQISITRG